MVAVKTIMCRWEEGQLEASRVRAFSNSRAQAEFSSCKKWYFFCIPGNSYVCKARELLFKVKYGSL